MSRLSGSTSFFAASALWGGMALAATTTAGKLAGFALAVLIAFTLPPMTTPLSKYGIGTDLQLLWLMSFAAILLMACCAYCGVRRLIQKDTRRAFRSLTVATHTVGMYLVCFLTLQGAPSVVGA